MDDVFKKEIAKKTYLRAVDGGPAAVCGVTAAGVHCGLKPGGKLDLALFKSGQPCRTAAFFTRNKLLGAHITVFRETLRANHNRCQALLVNSKNANCSTGPLGERDNLAVAAGIAKRLSLPPELVLFASTGVIGVRLPVDKIVAGLDPLVSRLGTDGIKSASEAIMTTDTRPKVCAVEVTQGRHKYTIGGVAKGAGMICPNMATMLAFIFTDADIPLPLLRSVSADCVEDSFNSISIDGDTSPNDTVLVMANGMSGVRIEAKERNNRARFKDALKTVMRQLSREIVRDGEGATKLVHIEIAGATNEEDARLMARGIAHSLLVKTAIFGGDPNWGRIVSAAATSGAEFDPLRTRLAIDGACVYDRGKLPPLTENIMKNKDVFISLDAGLGKGAARFWTCDLSYDYVKINAEYTT
jgi:glutamate N-acetyltransferase / amino-acid N-acetyltransferase